jgi:hypothetical protein
MRSTSLFVPLATTHQRNSVEGRPCTSAPAAASPSGAVRPSTVTVTSKVALLPGAFVIDTLEVLSATLKPVVPVIGRVTSPRRAPPSTRLRE